MTRVRRIISLYCTVDKKAIEIGYFAAENSFATNTMLGVPALTWMLKSRQYPRFKAALVHPWTPRHRAILALTKHPVLLGIELNCEIY